MQNSHRSPPASPLPFSSVVCAVRKCDVLLIKGGGGEDEDGVVTALQILVCVQYEENGKTCVRPRIGDHQGRMSIFRYTWRARRDDDDDDAYKVKSVCEGRDDGPRACFITQRNGSRRVAVAVVVTLFCD